MSRLRPRALVVPPVGALRFSDAPVLESSLVDSSLLRWVQGIVGGYIELVVPAQDRAVADWHAYVNEHGRIHGLQVNDRATELMQECGALLAAPILGVAVFLGHDHSQVEECDVPRAVWDMAVRLRFGPPLWINGEDPT